MNDLTLTVGDCDGEILAVISTGGHPQIPGSGQCVVCDAKKFPTEEDAREWFEQMKVERPWETRQ